MNRAGLTITIGVCWGCGCSNDDACFDEGNGLCCAWVDEAQTWCSVCALGYARAIIEAGAALREQGALDQTGGLLVAA